MQMVSMKVPEDDGLEPVKPNPYGYGLTLHLTDDQCEALGITTPPAAGTAFTIQARAVAKSVTSEMEEPGEGESAPDVYMCLQITDMGLQAEGQQRDIASMLYGS